MFGVWEREPHPTQTTEDTVPTITRAEGTDQLTPAHASIALRMLIMVGSVPTTNQQIASIKALSYSDLPQVADTISAAADTLVRPGSYARNLYSVAVLHLRCAAGAPDTTARGYHLDTAINELCAANMTRTMADASASAA